MKNNFIKIIFLVIILILFIYLVFYTFAKYKTHYLVEYKINILPWITENEILLGNTYTTENENTVKNKIAPNSKFIIPVEIKFSKVRMDVEYLIDITLPDKEIGNFIITTVREYNNKTGEYKTLEEKDSLYFGSIYKNEIGSEKEISHYIYIEIFWENNEEMNDFDTRLATAEEIQTLDFNVKLDFIQLKEEK